MKERLKFSIYCLILSLDYGDHEDKASYVADEVSDGRWTQWINVDDPTEGNFDFESVNVARRRFNICL